MKYGSEVCTPLNGFQFIPALPPATSSTGAVSPTTRAQPRMTAVTRPLRAVGSTTFHSVRNSPAPSARDASRRPPGTRRSTTSVARVTTGIISTDSASPAARPQKPWPSEMTKNAYTNRPATTEGIAVIASTTTRTTAANRPPTSFM